MPMPDVPLHLSVDPAIGEEDSPVRRIRHDAGRRRDTDVIDLGAGACGTFGDRSCTSVADRRKSTRRRGFEADHSATVLPRPTLHHGMLHHEPEHRLEVLA